MKYEELKIGYESKELDVIVSNYCSDFIPLHYILEALEIQGNTGMGIYATNYSPMGDGDSLLFNTMKLVTKEDYIKDFENWLNSDFLLPYTLKFIIAPVSLGETIEINDTTKLFDILDVSYTISTFPHELRLSEYLISLINDEKIQGFKVVKAKTPFNICENECGSEYILSLVEIDWEYY